LSDEALTYLRRQGYLQFLNLLSPMLYTNRSVTLPNHVRCNFAIRHFLTSFGSDIKLSVYLDAKDKRIALAYHQANNYKRAFPAVEAELIEKPFALLGMPLCASPRALVGMQPRGQRFMTKNAEFLGLVECRIDWTGKTPVQPWMALSLKTPGWVVGNVFLDANCSVRAGITARLQI
jgi:hypothetical protein